MPTILLGLLVLAGLYLVIRGFLNADPRTMARMLKILGGVAAAAVLVFLAVTGRLAAAIGILSVLGPLYLRWRAVKAQEKAAGGPTPGQNSTIRTRFLAMSLDHDSGTLQGEVLDGPLAGASLDDLDEQALLGLLHQCRREDPDSARLLETYLTRMRDADFSAFEEQASGDSGAPGGTGPMGRDEALSVLGLTEAADEAAVREAHRRLIKRFHPDQGGSDWLAARINEAKRVLLGS